MMRDLRDPLKLGRAYMRLRKHGLSAVEAVYAPADPVHDPDPVERYPRDVEVLVHTSYELRRKRAPGPKHVRPKPKPDGGRTFA
jgi:hypothetical protein